MSPCARSPICRTSISATSTLRSCRCVRDTLLDIGPDLVVVSGDLTQRARREEFEAARQLSRQPPVSTPRRARATTTFRSTMWWRGGCARSPDTRPSSARISSLSSPTGRSRSSASTRPGRSPSRTAASIRRQVMPNAASASPSVEDTGSVITRIVVAHHPVHSARGRAARTISSAGPRWGCRPSRRPASISSCPATCM